jgi:uncharacterized protein YkwD
MRRICRLPLVMLLAVALVGLAALAGPSAATARSHGPQGCADASRAPQQVGTRAAGRAVLCLLNRARAARGLRPLRSHPRLRRAATRHSQQMARARFFSHTTPSGASFATRVRRAGYGRGARGWALGENIAWGAAKRATPAAIVRDWLRSPGHRANILDRRFREIGVGIASGAPVRATGPGATYTTDFGVRR